MSRRAAPTHRAARHRKVRPRRGRIFLCVLAGLVTVVALMAGTGLLPEGDRSPASAAGKLPETLPPSTPSPSTVADVTTKSKPRKAAKKKQSPPASDALPADTGEGRRVVFAIGQQRVWLVDADDQVTSTYEVSGSLTDNLQPGDYRVYSRSRWAVGVDDSGVMQYFVRFAHGPKAAIGFHTIPTLNGKPLQTLAQLGTPQSHGCIRQERTDAIRLWEFAPVGTSVVVTA